MAGKETFQWFSFQHNAACWWLDVFIEKRVIQQFFRIVFFLDTIQDFALIGQYFGHNGFVFIMAQRRAFTRGAHGNQPVRSFANMPFDKFLQRLQIQFAALERRDECWHRAFEHDHAPFFWSGTGECPPVLLRLPQM